MNNLYETLGVKRDATPEQIKAAYRRAARKHHPDRGGDREEMQRVNDAYAVLSDPDKRRQYDETGEVAGASQPAPEVALFAALADHVLMQPGNIVRNMERELHNRIAELKDGAREGERAIRKFEARLAKLHGPAEGNLIADVFNGKIATLRDAMARDKKKLAVFEKMLVMLRDYRSDEPDAKQQSFGTPQSLAELADIFDSMKRYNR